MSDSNPFNGLPERVAKRARELNDAGLSPKRAIGLAVSELEYDADWDVEDVAEVMGVEPNTLRSHRSKAKNEIEQAARMLVLGAGGAATILAEYEPARAYHPFEKFYIISDFVGNEEYDEARNGESTVRLVIVRGGASGGHPDGNLDVTTKRFNSLDQMADEKYRDADFGGLEDAQKWHTMLVDAGVDEDSLEKPGEKLPASHPDSSDHFRYQMRSLEGPEDRRPPRRDR